MSIPTIEWDNGKVKLIDQTKLPQEFVYTYCEDIESLREAIRKMKVRGAPALGIAGALGVVLGIKDSDAKTFSQFKDKLNEVISCLSTVRPTGVNLFWALERMKKVALESGKKEIHTVKEILLHEALEIVKEDKTICRKIAMHGAKFIKDGDRILTHCNAGALATADYGTALGVIYRAKEQGKRVSVYVDETRPKLQGARLTCWELMQAGIDVILICDCVAASLMKDGRIDKVLVGADRIAGNGDCANKIGTYNLAILAKTHKIPFYIVAPISSFDIKIGDGTQIPIEERSPDEVRQIFGNWIAPSGVKVYNPAFDVTPAEFITAIVTEEGIIYPPYKKTIRSLKGII